VVEDSSGRRTETAAKCQFLIAETYLLEKNHEAALREYLKVRFLYKFPEWQAPALFQAAQCDEALGHWKEAVATYEELLRDFPTSEYATKGRPRLETARKRAGS
jgi:TolA-binding protein